MGQFLLLNHVRSHNEARLVADLRFHFLLVNRESSYDTPDGIIRCGIIFRASFLLIPSFFLIETVHCQKRWFSFYRLFPCSLSILLASKLLLGEMPELFLPLSLRFLHLLLHMPTLSLFCCLGAHDHPPFLALWQIHDAGSILS